jgi:hypothetical protein
VHVVADDRAVLGVPNEDPEQVVEGLVPITVVFAFGESSM